MCKSADIENMTIEEALKEYHHLKETEKGLEEKMKSVKKHILDKMGKKREIAVDGYSAKLTEKSRTTLSAELVESVLKVKVTEACYTKTFYDELRVTKK